MDIDASSFQYRGKSSDQIFRDLIFFSVGYRLPQATVVIKVGPNPFQASDALGRDTTAEIRVPRHDPAYRYCNSIGKKTVTYSRLQLSSLKPRWDVYFTPPTQPGSTYDLLDQINTYFDTCLTMDDLEDLPYNVDRFFLILQAKATSVAWQGQYGLLPQVDELIPIRKLNGFMPYSVPVPAIGVSKVILTGFTPVG